MSDTTARLRSERQLSYSENDPHGELQVRISCGERGAPEVLRELERNLGEAVASGRDPLVVLEDLGKLRDSVATLLKGVSRMLVGYPRSVTFWETSGYTEAFLSVMEPRQPGS